MCIGKEGENHNLERHMKDIPGWLRSKKRLVTTALDLARPGVSPHATRLAQSEETSERHVQASPSQKASGQRVDSRPVLWGCAQRAMVKQEG